jgi:tetratricopeptide (TPR) repeat protein
VRSGRLILLLTLAGVSCRAQTDAPKSADELVKLGEIDYRKGAIGAAEIDFKKAIQLDPKASRAWLGLGYVFQCASFHKMAKSCFDQAHALASADPMILRAWAGTLKGRERIEAMETYLQLAGGDPNAERLASARSGLDLQKNLGNRTLHRLISPYASSEIKFASLLRDPNRIRAFALPIGINGSKPLKLLADTGASGILISPKAAERIGLQKIGDLSFSGIGDEGFRGGYSALADRVKAGNVEFADCLIQVADRKLPTDTEGLIGTDVFAAFLITLDFQKRAMKLDPFPGLEAAPPDPDYSHDRTVTPALKSFAPVFRFYHALLISTKAGDAPPGLFLIDTGAEQTLIARDLAAQVTKVHGDGDLSMKGLSGKVKNVYSTGEIYLQFAGFRQRNIDMISFDLGPMSHSMGTEMGGILGLPLLNLFTLTIDYRDGLVKFDYQGQK